MDKYFEWYGSECSPDGYPCEIVRGEFILWNGLIYPMLTKQFCHNGWGKLGSEFYIGLGKKPVPAYLNITYLSHSECKVYSGEFFFDKDLLIKLLNEQITIPFENEKKMFDRILIGMAPLGIVSVWIYRDSVAKEICHFLCTESFDFEIDEHVAGFKNLKEYSLHQIQTNSPELSLQLQNTPSGYLHTKWTDLYRQPVSFDFEFHLLGEIESFQVWFFNGESMYHFPAKKEQERLLERMPERILVNWVRDNEERVISVISFHEASIFNTYENLSAFKKDISLIVQLREHDESIKVLMKSAEHVIEIEPKPL